MSCCQINRCFCPCVNLKTGMIIWAAIDLVLYATLVISGLVYFGLQGPQWFFVPVIILHTILIFAAKKSNIGFLIFWLFAMFIHAIFQVIATIHAMAIMIDGETEITIGTSSSGSSIGSRRKRCVEIFNLGTALYKKRPVNRLTFFVGLHNRKAFVSCKH